MDNTLHSSVLKHLPTIVEVRHRLHAHPELSFQEFETSRYLQEVLEAHGITCRRLSQTGIVAEIHGRTATAHHPIVLRADLDALPIHESTQLAYTSQTAGVMHACGHDIHAASLLGTLLILNDLRDQYDGTFWGVFQPGEELSPGGASVMIADGLFAGTTPRAIIGQHVAHDLPVGQWGMRSGKYMASADEVHLTVRSTGGHAAQPDTYADPVMASAHLLVSMQQIVSRNAPPSVPTVLSFGRLIAEGATNVIPSEVKIEGTFRTMDEAWRQRGRQRITEVAQGTAQAWGVEIEVEFGSGYPAVINDPHLTEFARTEAIALTGVDSIIDLPIRMTAEDFGFYGTIAPSLFYRLGVGYEGCGRPHTAQFAPQDEVLKGSVLMMSNLAMKINAKF